MQKLLLLCLSVSVLLINGCAHSSMRGSVAMKATDEELHVCMGDQEIKAGDRVAFFFNDCRRTGGKETTYDICTKIKLGEGLVTRTLNEHYSVVKPDSGMGAKITEGTVVEKL